MKNIVILTGNHLRHQYFRIRLASVSGLSVLVSFCEETKNSKFIRNSQDDSLLRNHLEKRDASEVLFFETYCSQTIDQSNPVVIRKGEVNDDVIVEQIRQLSPDLIITYGCSIIRSPLIDLFPQKIINVHLGLSPYYRGSGTNYFPFVNNEPIFCGVTFLYLDKGVDTGEIIHQLRADVQKDDDVHSIGNRLIAQMTDEMIRLIHLYPNFASCNKSPDYPIEPRRLYKNLDFTRESLLQMYDNFKAGMLQSYLENREKLEKKYPIKSMWQPITKD